MIILDPLECEDCGTLFCKKCIEDYILKGINKSCPNCRVDQFNCNPIKGAAKRLLNEKLTKGCYENSCDKYNTMITFGEI